MANVDWRDVYMEERQRPGYVLENGTSPVRINDKTRLKRETKPPTQKKERAA